MESINIYIFIMKNKRYLFIVCRICTFNCHIDIFNLNNVEIVEGLVILRGMTRCVTALFPKKFSMKKYFYMHTRFSFRCCYSRLFFIFIEKNIHQWMNQYQLEMEKQGQRNNIPLHCLNINTISSFITIIITFSLLVQFKLFLTTRAVR